MLFYNAVIFGDEAPFKGWLRVGDDGHIAEMGEGDAPQINVAEESLDCKGLWLLPGVIDSHVHFREPGGEHKATIASESRAAVAGGVTSFMEMPNTTPQTTTLEALEDKHQRAAKDSVANYSFYLGATSSNIDVLRNADFSRIPAIKLFMGSSTGGMLVDGEDKLEQIFQLGRLVMTHCEDEQIIRQNMQAVRAMYPEGEEIPVSWHPVVRSALACYKSTKHAMDLAQKYGTRLHVAHISTLQELELLQNAPANITAEACLPHLLFSDEDYATRGTLIKCNPAVKSTPHRATIRRAVLTGLISTVSTDHAPHTLAEKERGGLLAPSGMPMVQFSLPAMLDMSLAGLWPVQTVVQRMCHAQADLYGVVGRGYLRPGYWADMVLVDPTGTTKVNSDTILSQCGWSPLDGLTLASSVVATYVNGTMVYSAKEGVIESAVRSAQPLHFEHN